MSQGSGSQGSGGNPVASSPSRKQSLAAQNVGSPEPVPSTSTSVLPDPALPAPNLAQEETGFTAADLIAQQARLEAQANEAIPFQFDTCTHDRGYIRQPVYACKTCGGGGVCAGCSVSCHAEHDLVELFNKRHFRCDCGTPNLYKDKHPNHGQMQAEVTGELRYPPGAKPCSLRKPGFDPQNDANKYSHNFVGSFCYCVRGRTYDPEKEEETMFQCIVCEEWLHESCTSLQPPTVDTRLSTTPDASQLSTLAEPPPPLIDHDLFDLMICDTCVRKPGNEMLRHYAGSQAWMILAPSQDVSEISEWDGIPKIQVPTAAELLDKKDSHHNLSWQIFGLPMDSQESITQTEMEAAVDNALLSSAAILARSSQQEALADAGADPTKPEPDETTAEASRKRPADTGGESSETYGEGKKAKRETDQVEKVEASHSMDSCRLPTPLPIIHRLPASQTGDWEPSLAKEEGVITDGSQQRYDIFLSEDFRTRICRCTNCLPKWSTLPYVLDAEETYAPPSDPQASVHDDDAASITSSTYDLGMAALRSMPREKMIDSLHAYGKFRDALWEHLRPFAGSGKIVKEEDVRAFFKKTLNTDK